MARQHAESAGIGQQFQLVGIEPGAPGKVFDAQEGLRRPGSHDAPCRVFRQAGNHAQAEAGGG